MKITFLHFTDTLFLKNKIFSEERHTMRERVSGQTMQEYLSLFKALGEETRLLMIGLLGDRELCVCDFMEVLDLVQSTASRHLAYLKNSGWVIGRREGKWMYYRLDPSAFIDPVQSAVIKHITGLPEIQMVCEKMSAHLEQKDKVAACS